MYTCYGTGDIVILEAITFREKLMSDDDSFRFTLTCISSGGPATNVTWKRNSESITNGMRTMLDDSLSVNPTYTHTLTVTGRLGGLYQCTVSNDKPSNDSSSIFIQGDMYIVHVYCYIISLFFCSCIRAH